MRSKNSFAMSLLTITAGPVFLTSVPIEGSKLIHHASPRRGNATLLRAIDLSYGHFTPLACFFFSQSVRRHFSIGNAKGSFVCEEGGGSISEKTTDIATPNFAQKRMVHVGIYKDGESFSRDRHMHTIIHRILPRAT